MYYDHLQIAEVVRKGEGGYEYRETYVPPCLTWGFGLCPEGAQPVARASRGPLQVPQ